MCYITNLKNLADKAIKKNPNKRKEIGELLDKTLFNMENDIVANDLFHFQQKLNNIINSEIQEDERVK